MSNEIHYFALAVLARAGAPVEQLLPHINLVLAADDGIGGIAVAAAIHAVAGFAGDDVALPVAVVEQFLRHGNGLGYGPFIARLGGEVGSDIGQISIADAAGHGVHGGMLPFAALKILELLEDVVGRVAGQLGHAGRLTVAVHVVALLAQMAFGFEFSCCGVAASQLDEEFFRFFVGDGDACPQQQGQQGGDEVAMDGFFHEVDVEKTKASAVTEA